MYFSKFTYKLALLLTDILGVQVYKETVTRKV